MAKAGRYAHYPSRKLSYSTLILALLIGFPFFVLVLLALGIVSLPSGSSSSNSHKVQDFSSMVQGSGDEGWFWRARLQQGGEELGFSSAPSRSPPPPPSVFHGRGSLSSVESMSNRLYFVAVPFILVVISAFLLTNFSNIKFPSTLLS